jgi:uncharacterized membrane protein
MWLTYASAAALCFGLRGILYHWTSQKPIDRNLLLFGVFMSGAIVAILLNLLFHQPWNHAAFTGVFMGLFSFTSNAAIYKGFSVGKASLVAIFTALPPIVVIVIAYMLWRETLSLGQGLAFIIIFSGIILIRYSNEISFTNLKGVQWGLLAMFGFGITDIFTKESVRSGGETLPTLTIMYLTGSLIFLITWLHSKRRKHVQATSTSIEKSESTIIAQWGSFKTLLWGMVVGLTNILGMILLLPAFKLGITGLVSTVIATNVLLIILYARVFLHEKFKLLELMGLSLAFVGVIVLKLVG